MEVTDLKNITLQSLTDREDNLARLLSIHPYYPFKREKNTDSAEGILLECGNENNFVKFKVKVPGKDLKAFPSNQDIEKQATYVSFTNFRSRFYWNRKQEKHLHTAKAEDVQVVEPSTKSRKITTPSI